MDDKKPPGRPRGRTPKLKFRLHEVLKVLATAPLSDASVIERFSKEWSVTPRTIERMIHQVRMDGAADLAVDRRSMVAQMATEIRGLYKLCIAKGRLEAAGRCQDRYMRLVGLEAARRVELTGRDGAPVSISSESYDLSARSDEELEVLERVLGMSPATSGDTTH